VYIVRVSSQINGKSIAWFYEQKTDRKEPSCMNHVISHLLLHKIMHPYKSALGKYMVQSNKKSPRTRKRVGLELHLTCSKNEILVVLIVLVKISLFSICLHQKQVRNTMKSSKNYKVVKIKTIFYTVTMLGMYSEPVLVLDSYYYTQQTAVTTPPDKQWLQRDHNQTRCSPCFKTDS